MADSITALLQLVDQETGNNDGTWGDIADANFQKLENAIAGRTTISATGGTVALTDDQARSAMLLITGTLVSNLIIAPPARTKSWIVENQTTGNFTVTVQTQVGGASGYRLPRGRRRFLWCDGTNIDQIEGAGSVPIGGYIDFSGSSLPVDYLLCDGSAVSRATFAKLFEVFGTAYGAGDGSTTFNLPNLQDRYKRGASGTYGTSTVLAQDVQSHAHSASSDTTGAHTHGASASGSQSGTSGSAGNHSHTVSGSASGTVSVSGTTSSDNAHSHTYSDVQPNAPTASFAAGGTNGVATTTTASSLSTSSVAAHSHTVTSTGANTLTIDVGATTNSVAAHTHSYSVDFTLATITVASAGAHSHVITVAATGGTETRPNSLVVLPCIRYQ